MTARHSSALAVPMVALIACGGGGSTDIEGTITFADRTDLEITRFINAAGGVEMFQAEGAVDSLGDTFDPDPNCPTIAVDGNVVTITGGCTTTEGVQIDGSASVTNPFGWDQVEYEFTDDTLFEMHGLVITQSGFAMSYDGFIRRSDNLATYDADITVTQQGVPMRSDLYYHCSNPSSPRCSVSGSGLELIGVGGATLSGGLRAEIDDDTVTQTADYTLEGTDTLTVHINEQRCVSWEIEGTERGNVCAP
jgi:hypothetical protein